MNTASHETLRHGGVLAGLAEALDVNFHGFAQAGDLEVPFLGEAVSPAAGFHFGAKLAGEDVDNLPFSGGGIEIEIVAEIG